MKFITVKRKAAKEKDEPEKLHFLRRKRKFESNMLETGFRIDHLRQRAVIDARRGIRRSDDAEA